MTPRQNAKTLATALIDRHVALRLRAARIQANRSQEEAARALGLSFQQLQKYEKGTNRISAGKLTMLARFYGRPVAWFFENAPGDSGPSDRPDIAAQILSEPTGSRLVEHYLMIPSDIGRRAVAGVAAAFAGQVADEARPCP